MFKFFWNVSVLLTVAIISAALINKRNHAEFDDTMKDYIKKSTLTNAMGTCDELNGQFAQYGFANAEKQYFFCRIK